MKDFLDNLGKHVLIALLIVVGLFALLSTACSGLFAMGGTDRAAGQVFVASVAVLMLCLGGLRAIRVAGKKDEAAGETQVPGHEAPGQPSGEARDQAGDAQSRERR
jgi:hypothetical protein